MAHPEPIQSDAWVDDRMAALQVADAWQPDGARQLADAHARGAALAARRRRTLGVAVAAVAVFAAVPATRALGARCVEACVNLTMRVTQFWQADEPAASRPKIVGAIIGAIAPDAVGVTSSGVPIRLSALRGQVVVLNFWATWCAPCREEIPVLNDLHHRYGAQGLNVIGVSLDDDGWSAVAPFVSELGVTYQITLGDDEVANAFGGVTALPATFIIDRDGIIHVHYKGPLTRGQFEERIS